MSCSSTSFTTCPHFFIWFTFYIKCSYLFIASVTHKYQMCIRDRSNSLLLVILAPDKLWSSAFEMFFENSSRYSPIDIYAVSYTHLAVYQRQIYCFFISSFLIPLYALISITSLLSFSRSSLQVFNNTNFTSLFIKINLLINWFIM